MDTDTKAPPGLTTAEAEAERRKGGGNTVPSAGTRGYLVIVRTNLFSFFNIILFVIGVALLSMSRYSDALVSVGLGVINACISTAQEIGAKRKLDRLQLLDREPVIALRDGREVELAPHQVVRGDVLVVRAGSQLVVDGPLIDGGPVEADESLLTGESEPVVKHVDDELLSGSLCVAGQGHQLARGVGANSYAGRLTTEARRSTTDTTPLQRQISFLVRLLMALTALMSCAILAQAALEGFSVLRVVQITAVLSGLVPYGLFFLIAVSYTAGSAALSSRGALVQQVNAVESMSNVNVVCTDKTGTLTTGKLTVHAIEGLGEHEAAQARRTLAALARSATTPNLTTTALAAELGDQPEPTGWAVRDEIPFSSSLRWSGAVTEDGGWVLGAPEALGPHLIRPVPAESVTEHTSNGLRVLVLARAAEGTGLRDSEGRPHLPDLEPVALVVLADELRPAVADTVRSFHADQIALKVISGDNPRTVAALAQQAGLEPGEPISGEDIDRLDDAELERVVESTTVFGRIAPEQKERIVGALRRRGHYVAMIGDGVNDARALKGAQVGVAMRSGSAVTRDVADIVLVEDSLAALVPAQHEGRKIINGIAISLYVFLARVAAQGLVILAVTMLGLGFPYSPTQVGLTLLTVGVPTFFLTFWADSNPPDQRLLSNLMRFVIPAGVITAGIGTAVYAISYQQVMHGFSTGRTPAEVISDFENYTGEKYGVNADFAQAASTIGAQTALMTFFCLASFVFILFLAPPHRIFAAWTAPVRDRRPAWLVVGLLIVFAAVLFVPALYDYFGLTGPAKPVFMIVLPAMAIWFLALTAVFRLRLLDRSLGLDHLPKAGQPRS